ncbi:hypothetical protein WSM22_46600 [Cytophagales bacterium WSM2-2]|nr:hypothetical protein WSM22_46600 [Cytophagales bacterium WSM2-2]
MNKKIIYLFLALLLPVLVFVFLKLFGKNHFDIPVYYSDGVKEVPADCNLPADGQYSISKDQLSKAGWGGSSGVLINDSLVTDVAEIQKISANIGVRFELVSVKDWTRADKKCILLLKNPWNVVLIDEQRRIRGYYKTGNREEMDRLEVELKILLKKY